MLSQLVKARDGSSILVLLLLFVRPLPWYGGMAGDQEDTGAGEIRTAKTRSQNVEKEWPET